MAAADRVHSADADRIQAGVIGNWDNALNHPAQPTGTSDLREHHLGRLTVLLFLLRHIAWEAREEMTNDQ